MQKHGDSYTGVGPFVPVTACSGSVLVAPASTTPGASSKARDSAHIEYRVAEGSPWSLLPHYCSSYDGDRSIRMRRVQLFWWVAMSDQYEAPVCAERTGAKDKEGYDVQEANRVYRVQNKFARVDL
jgi:hypothetical protein